MPYYGLLSVTGKMHAVRLEGCEYEKRNVPSKNQCISMHAKPTDTNLRPITVYLLFHSLPPRTDALCTSVCLRRGYCCRHWQLWRPATWQTTRTLCHRTTPMSRSSCPILIRNSRQAQNQALAKPRGV
jgi:hypothetical protein